jgi:hypothetical protein
MLIRQNVMILVKHETFSNRKKYVRCLKATPTLDIIEAGLYYRNYARKTKITFTISKKER